VRDLRLFNEALLGKWLWIFMNEKSNLWRKAVSIKYSATSLGRFPSSPNGPYGCSLWRYISKCWGRFFPYCSFEVGDDSTISFWHNRRFGEGPLKELFPGLYSS